MSGNMLDKLVGSRVKIVYEDVETKAIKGTLIDVSEYFLTIRGFAEENVMMINRNKVISIKELKEE